jgi:hypothetical protein
VSVVGELDRLRPQIVVCHCFMHLGVYFSHVGYSS